MIDLFVWSNVDNTLVMNVKTIWISVMHYHCIYKMLVRNNILKFNIIIKMT